MDQHTLTMLCTMFLAIYVSLHPAKCVGQPAACTADGLVPSMDVSSRLAAAAVCLLALHAVFAQRAAPRPGICADHLVCTSVDLYASLPSSKHHLVNNALLPGGDQEGGKPL